MIATFFRWRLVAGGEAHFRDRWLAATHYFHGQGSHGSSLWRDDEGCVCAFALWPSRETRDRAFAMSRETGLEPLSELIDETLARIDMDLLENAWRLLPSGGQSTEID